MPTRRQFTFQLAGTTLSVAALAACRDLEPADDSGGHALDSTDTGADSADTAESGDTSDTGTSHGWATGGTAGMSAEYPDPFTDDASTECALFCEMTLGPCYAQTIERQDISEGVTGLPTRLAIRVVDDACNPVAGAIVDIWHCAPGGLYSGEDANEVCTEGDAAAIAGRWFRGMLTTDAEGRVDFNTCFPGWYPGRAVHIHIQIRKGEDTWSTSQLFFDEALIADVYTTHPEYVGYGVPDRKNVGDGVLAGADPAPFVVESARMEDGSLQVWKTVVIRSSLSEQSCAV